MDDTDELHRAVGTFGTPLYVYELEHLRVRAQELKAVLPRGSTLYYSLKANPLAPLCAELRTAGCGAEVSSVGELTTALNAGFAAPDVLFTGPGKSVAELEQAVRCGVTISCESETELQRLAEVGRSGRANASVLIRLQPGSSANASLSMSDNRQFGFQVHDAVHALRHSSPGCEIRGFHVYLGSQVQSDAELVEGVRIAKVAVEETCSLASFRPEVADLGGGFPWPYAEEGLGCDLRALRPMLEDLLVPWLAPPSGLRFESGRRLVASAGRLLNRVVDRKSRGGETVIVVDAGINVLGGMAGLGRVLRPTITFENLSRGACADADGAAVRVVGPLCTPLDRLSAGSGVLSAQVGDLLCVPNVGAYALTASLTSFLSRRPPVEAVFDGGECVGAWQLRHQHQAL